MTENSSTSNYRADILEADRLTEDQVRTIEGEAGQLNPQTWRDRFELHREDPMSFVHFMSLIDGEQYQQLKIEERHGHALSRLQEIVEGELDYEVMPNGKIRHNIINELAKHSLRSFDKQASIGLVAYGIASIFDGGVSLPGFTMLAGRTAARMISETGTIVSGQERRIHRQMVRKIANEWQEVNLLAEEILNPETQIDEIIAKLERLVNIFYTDSKGVELAQKQEDEVEAVNDQRRQAFGKAGAITGALGGAIMALSDYDGYNVEDFSRNAIGLAAALIGMGIGAAIEPLSIKSGEISERQATERRLLLRDALLDKIAKLKSEKVAETQTEPVASQRKNSPVSEIPAYYKERIKYLGKVAPQPNKIWLIIEPSGERKAVLVQAVDWENGIVDVSALDISNNLSMLPGLENIRLKIDELIEKGHDKDNEEKEWLKKYEDGDKVILTPFQHVINRNDKTGVKTLDAGKEYILKKSGIKGGMVELTASGEPPCLVSVFDLIAEGVLPLK